MSRRDEEITLQSSLLEASSFEWIAIMSQVPHHFRYRESFLASTVRRVATKRVT